MSDQQRSVEEELGEGLRIGLAIAAQGADRAARARADLARDAAAHRATKSRQLTARLEGEGASAIARLSVVERRQWWDHASPEQVAAVWELARQWQADQPRAAAALDTVTVQVADRYGIDLTAPGVTSEQLRAAVAQAEADLAATTGGGSDGAADLAAAIVAVEAAEQRDRDLAPDEAAPAEERLSGIDRAGAVVQEARVPGYDSPERREQTRRDLTAAGIEPGTVEVALRADMALAVPPAAPGPVAAARAGFGAQSQPARRQQVSDRSR